VGKYLAIVSGNRSCEEFMFYENWKVGTDQCSKEKKKKNDVGVREQM
jgi:hypothetical protein